LANVGFAVAVATAAGAAISWWLGTR
jgi:hypothetical protein